ncbi:MAG: thermonuclease family protein [Verrucomicrobiales bacterium]
MPELDHLYEYRARVTDVYDGDTVTVDVDLGFNVWIHAEEIRLLGIDAPDVRGPERPEGLVSRDALRDLIDGKDVVIRTVKDPEGKDPRYLADVFVENEAGELESVNRILVDRGLATRTE